MNNQDDEHEIGKSAIKYNIPAITTISAAKFMVRAIRTQKTKSINYYGIYEYYKLF